MHEDSERGSKMVIPQALVLGAIAVLLTALISVFIDLKSDQAQTESKYQERTQHTVAWLNRLDQEQQRARSIRGELRERISSNSEQLVGQDDVFKELLIMIKEVQALKTRVEDLGDRTAVNQSIMRQHIIESTPYPHSPLPGPR